MNNITMIFNKLVIRGVDNEYVCHFKKGLNLIWGDLDSGKSSILNLIDYALGGNFDELQLDYDELRAKGRFIQLEVEFNSEVVTIERVLGSKINTIKLYKCRQNETENVYPLICGASSSSSEPDGWLSDTILDMLSIPKVRIKESKKKDNADSDRLSFRDLMKLVYLKQKKVAGDNLMDAANPYVHNKNIEVQKFIYGVHDDQLSELNEQLKIESSMIASLKRNAQNIRDFLKSTDSLVDTSEEYESISRDLELIDKEIDLLKNSKNHALVVSNGIKNQISSLDERIKTISRSIRKDKDQLKSYSKLKSTYQHDISCVKASLKMRELLSERELQKNKSSCPLCSSMIELSDPVIDNQSINYEINSLRNRLSGCDKAIKTLLDKIKNQVSEKEALEKNLGELRSKFDVDNLEFLSPTIDALIKAESLKRNLIGHHSLLKKNIMLTKKLDDNYTQIESRGINLEKIKREISTIESELDSIDDVINDISSEFSALMARSKLTNNYGASIDFNFMPVFRNRKYSQISSGGVRTILSVNLYIARIKYILKNGAHLPSTLLLDTPGQNIGRYARKDSNESENLSDPSIYEEIYQQIKEIKDLSEDMNYQIIVVDNDLPNCLDESDFNLVKRFDKSNSDYEKGLINDA
ncbi:AAA family ATPase [Vibrio owensii]|uniref:AAA family ATPase n=1 Tax=Vibrio owensii TaxID=696485 RepID=UPI0038CE6A0F